MKCKCGHHKENHLNKDGSLGFCIVCDFLSYTGAKCDKFQLNKNE